MNFMVEFNSFFMGGFECADHINRNGIRVNLQKITEHDIRVFDDYKLLNSIGIQVVREGICWSVVEKEPYVFDFSHLIPFYKAAAELKIQIIWDLCHFGFPSDLAPAHPEFSKRFQSLAEAFCMFHSENSTSPLMVIPINEISYLSWLAGEARGTVPFAIHNGWDIKYHLCKAAIRAIKTIKSTLPDAVIIAAEPLIKVHPSPLSETSEPAKTKHEYQYQAMDILLGRMCPELGGEESLIDVFGVNYYCHNQWNDRDETLPWPDPEKLRTSFSDLLKEAYSRYQLPMIISETGHFGRLRPEWLREICNETRNAMNQGVDLLGICLYPIIDRPDWDDLDTWCYAGLWDLNLQKERIPNLSYLRCFNRFTSQFASVLQE